MFQFDYLSAFQLLINFGIVSYASWYVIQSYYYKNLKVFDYFIIWFAFIYAVVPCFYIYDRKEYMLEHFSSIIPQAEFIFESIVVLISFIFCIAGYKTYNGKGFKLVSKISSNKSLYNFSLVLFVLSILSYIFFVYRYGGVEYLLNNVSSVRSGSDENKDYLGAFISLFSNLLMYAFILQIFLYFKKFFKRKLFASFLFIFLISLLISKAFLGGGRAGIIIIFIYSLLGMVYLKEQINKKFLVIAAFIGFFIIFFGKTYLFHVFSSEINIDFSEVRNRQESIGYIKLFIYEFNHQFLSLSNFVHNNYEFRYFIDYVIWLFKPLKLITSGNNYDSISYYNTYLILGEWDSNIPPGFIALGYINGGLIGVILQSFIVGLIIRIIDKTFKNSDFKNSGILFFIYLCLFNLSWFSLQNGDIALIIQSNLVFILLVFYLFLTKRIIIKRM